MIAQSKFLIHTFLIMTFICSVVGAADDGKMFSADSAILPSVRLAVLPLVNYCGRAEAVTVFSPLINDYISRGEFTLIDSGSLDRELRKYRIRSTATIGFEDAARMAGDLGIDYFMLGSIDIFLPDQIPEAAISLRVVDAGDMSILWATSTGASGQDYVGMLGIGRITSMEQLARQLTEESLGDFNSRMIYRLAQDPARSVGPLHALVVFDNLSTDKHAGDIITMTAISDLAANNIRILEPGAALELFRQNGQFPRGEVDLTLLKQLHERFKVERVITGSVDLFLPAPAGGETSTPEIELGGRYLDAATGKVLAAAELSCRGTDSETIFRLGITRSLGKLTRNATHLLLEKLHVFEK